MLGVYSDSATQTHTYPDGSVVQFLSVAFVATLLHRVAEPDEREVAELGWFHPHELPAPIFGPDVPIIRDFLARPGTGARVIS